MKELLKNSRGEKLIWTTTQAKKTNLLQLAPVTLNFFTESLKDKQDSYMPGKLRVDKQRRPGRNFCVQLFVSNSSFHIFPIPTWTWSYIPAYPPIPFLSLLSVPPPNFELYYYIILTRPSLYLLLVYSAPHWGPVNRVISLSLKVTSMTWIWNKNSTSLTDWQIILKHSPSPSFMLSCAGNITNRINRGKFKSSTREQTGKKKKKKRNSLV